MAEKLPELRQRSLEPYMTSVEMLAASSYEYPHSDLEANGALREEGSDSTFSDIDVDGKDMLRLGKKQEFKRKFGFWSALAFVSVYMGTWEFVLVSLSLGFSNGGFAGLFWIYIPTCVCFASITASLAEMASMAPTSGGQYHWTSEFAPPQYQRLLSYASGWLSSLGWLSSIAASYYISATQVQSLVNIYMPDLEFTQWQLTLMMTAVAVITILLNTIAAPILPAVEIASLFVHASGFLVITIVLLVLCPKNSAADVFLTFTNDSGYESLGATILTSQVYILFCILGSDSISHISEEVHDASVNVPRAMWWSYVGNNTCGLIMLVVLLFCIGPIENVLGNLTPYLTLFDNTGSPGVSFFLSVYLFVALYVGNITTLATASREIFAFARDRGLPFSSWLSKIDGRWHIPLNAVFAASAITALLSLIPLGSTLAFNIIASIALLSLLSTYMLSIGCVLWRRLSPEPLPPARWSLGRWGVSFNIFALAYSIFVIVFCCMPTTLPVTTDNANWTPALWVGFVAFAFGYYIFWGRKHYTAPVNFVFGHRAPEQAVQTST